MIDPTPESTSLSMFLKAISGQLSLIWFVLIAILGGTVNYISRIKRKEVQGFSIAELIGEWLISGFAALLTAYLCIEAQLSWHMTAFLCGISGHLGARAIYVFENLFNCAMKKYFDIPNKKD